MTRRLRAVVMFPLDGNPYQRLLADALRDAGLPRVIFLRRYRWIGPLLFPLQALVARLRGARVLHLHWVAFSLPWRVPFRYELSTAFTRLCLVWVRILGFSTVWTVHNIVPHQRETADDLAIAQRVAGMADAVIVHSRTTSDRMAALGIDAHNQVEIPHGNYVGHYPDRESRDEARRRLGLEPDATVLLFFGQIRPYKGVARLIEAFEQLPDDGLRLVIAGSCGDPEVAALMNRDDADPRVRLVDEHVADDQVARYFRAADIVCLPMLRIATSGSAVLAVSFGLPLVSSTEGDLGLLPRSTGFFYDNDDPSGLPDALRAAVSRRDLWPEMASASRALSDDIGWDRIGRRTLDVYEQSAGPGRR